MRDIDEGYDFKQIQMMNHTYKSVIYLFFMTLLIFKGVESPAQLTKSDIDKAIEISALEHPYLYFNNAEKKQLIDRIKTDQESKDVFRKLRAMAKVWMAMPVDKNIPIRARIHVQIGPKKIEVENIQIITKTIEIMLFTLLFSIK